MSKLQIYLAVKPYDYCVKIIIWYGSPVHQKKRLIIGSIFPEKLTFDGKRFQTTRLNEGARLIYMLNESLSEKKNGQSKEISTLSCSVTRIGSQYFI
jgi:site-specific DNA recombinase